MNLLKFKFFRNIIITSFEKLGMGSDIFAAKIVAFGKNDGRPGTFECTITGENQTQITAKVAAIVARNIYINNYPSGIYQIEQLFNLEDIIDPLKKSMSFMLIKQNKNINLER